MTSTSQNTSPLFWLPDELLVLIVEQTLAEGRPAAALLRTCPRLARITSEVHYARIVYGGEMRSYDELVEIMDARPGLRKLVQDLTIAPIFDPMDRLADYSWAYPGTARILIHFPSLNIIRFIGASPDQIDDVLSAPPGPILPPLQHISIEDPASDSAFPSDSSWWKALSRFPDLAELSFGSKAYDEGDRRTTRWPQMPAEGRGMHTLNIRQLEIPNGGAAAFAAFPALTRLTLEDGLGMISRWLSIAPLGLTHIALRYVFSRSRVDNTRVELSQDLGRFPRLQSLRLSDFGYFFLEELVPFLRGSGLRHIELEYVKLDDFLLTSDLILGLLDGPERIRRLESMRLSLVHDDSRTNDQKLVAYLQERIKRSLSDHRRSEPKVSVSAADDVQRLVEAARSNGVRLAGAALRCVGWRQRYQHLAERCFVDHALATNDYTILERQYGKTGAADAIRRQRSLLMAVLSLDSS